MCKHSPLSPKDTSSPVCETEHVAQGTGVKGQGLAGKTTRGEEKKEEEKASHIFLSWDKKQRREKRERER